MSNTFRSLALSVSLVAFAASGLMPNNSLILCITPTGQVSFEATYWGAECPGCPEIQSAQENPFQPLRFDQDDSVCPCIDLPVGASGAAYEKRTLCSSSKFQGLSPSLCSTPQRLEPGRSVIPVSPYSPPGSSYRSLLQVRTVILLV